MACMPVKRGAHPLHPTTRSCMPWLPLPFCSFSAPFHYHPSLLALPSAASHSHMACAPRVGSASPRGKESKTPPASLSSRPWLSPAARPPIGSSAQCVPCTYLPSSSSSSPAGGIINNHNGSLVTARGCSGPDRCRFLNSTSPRTIPLSRTIPVAHKPIILLTPPGEQQAARHALLSAKAGMDHTGSS